MRGKNIQPGGSGRSTGTGIPGTGQPTQHPSFEQQQHARQSPPQQRRVGEEDDETGPSHRGAPRALDPTTFMPALTQAIDQLVKNGAKPREAVRHMTRHPEFGKDVQGIFSGQAVGGSMNYNTWLRTLERMELLLHMNPQEAGSLFMHKANGRQGMRWLGADGFLESVIRALEFWEPPQLMAAYQPPPVGRCNTEHPHCDDVRQCGAVSQPFVGEWAPEQVQVPYLRTTRPLGYSLEEAVELGLRPAQLKGCTDISCANACARMPGLYSGSYMQLSS